MIYRYIIPFYLFIDTVPILSEIVFLSKRASCLQKESSFVTYSGKKT